MKLFCPGPVNIKDSIKKTEIMDISHRGKKFQDLFYNCCKVTKEMFNIKNDDYSCLFLCGSGTLSIETMIYTFLKNHKVLLIQNGGFSEKWELLLKQYSQNYKTIKFDWGNEFEIPIIEKSLQNDSYDYIFFVHHETTTTMINDITPIHDLAVKYNINLAIDIVSSVGAYNIDLIKYNKISMLGYSCNKFIGINPGLAVNIVKKNLFNGLQDDNSYLHLKKYYLFSEINETPFTPCVQNYYYYYTSVSELICNNKNDLQENMSYLIKKMSEKKYIPYLKNINNQCNWVINFFCENPSYIYDFLYKNNIAIYKGKKHLEKNIIQIAIYNKTKDDIDLLVDLL